MDGDEFDTVRKGRFHLHIGDHLGDAIHDLFPVHDMGPGLHQVGHAAAIAGALKNFIGEDGYALRVVEFQPATLSTPRQIRGDNDQQLFLLAGAEMHGRPLNGEVLFDNLIRQLSHRAPRDNVAAIQDGKIVREFLAKIEVLLNEQDGHCLFAA